MTNYRRVARRKAEKYGINPRYFKRQIRQESNFDPNAHSPAGAQGIAEFMPSTAAGLGVNPMHPRQALDAAAKLMSTYLRQYNGSWSKALTAYNAGPGAVGGALPAETQNYIHTILRGGPDKQAAPGKARQQPRGPSKLKFNQFGVKTQLKDVVDTRAFEQARKGFVLGNLLSRHGTDSPLFKSGLLSTTMPQVGDFQRQVLTSKVTKRQRQVKLSGGGGSGGNLRSADSPHSVRRMLDTAEAWDHAKVSYLWGGGHGSTPAKPGQQVDCSGYVSAILGIAPRDSTHLMSYGKKGPGRFVTVYANSGHTLVSIRNPRNGHVRWYATSHSNPGGGAGQIAPPDRGYLSSFVRRHPRGL